LNLTRFNKKLLLLAFIGLFLYYIAQLVASNQKNGNFDQNMPIPQVTQTEAADTAIALLRTRFPLNPGKPLVVYESNKPLSIYLQKNRLSQLYSYRFGEKFPLNFWQVEVWDDTSGQSYVVNVSMEKPFIIGWAVNLSKASVSHDDLGDQQQALAAANGYLLQAGFNLADWTVSEKKNNVDSQVFIYKNRSERIGDAVQQITVGVSGNAVTYYNTDFAIPLLDQAWTDLQEGNANLMYWASMLFILFVGICAVIITIRKRKQVVFKQGIVLAATCFIANSISTFNSLPSAGILYGEHSTIAYQVTYLTLNLGFNLLLSLTVYFALIAGVQMWREQGWNPLPRWRDEQFGKSVLHGMGRSYLLCLFVIGVQQILFLFAGNLFHSFSVNDPSQSELNLLWPWAAPSMAWMAAISEEIIFRLFAIVLLQKIFRNRWIAILLPCIAWALGHAAYSVYPSYTRIFEVTILGFIFSYIFLRYGLITALFTHAIMDSTLMGLSLIFTMNTAGYNIVGCFYIILPVIIGSALMLLKRRWRPHSDLNLKSG